MLTAAQLRAARALLGLDQRRLAEAAGLSLPTIQRMEASEGTVRGNVDSLVKLVEALERVGVEFIAEGSPSGGGGRGVRLRAAASTPPPIAEPLPMPPAESGQ
ncbi:helix-turn-helix domain-containing protein [Candidatus Thiodictyon syntrophicum]|jgi:transcriptional regulator with XRE-family HTH domain|uniref:Transcriptional regulator n=1 Tax=Candidatus Thiodictyon syntrophicum TaxID=1166950 RepID=A0A2K8U838_9GAMM|nr:helix-turn-helix transcriptional regulator [Candidatus Thiodictyon syntrophicum]AUB81733.1 transcriptional regulator [Candidatus Thiodictyon syntrophicum]